MLLITKLECTFFFVFWWLTFPTLFPFTQVLAHSGEYSYYSFKATFGNTLYNYLLLCEQIIRSKEASQPSAHCGETQGYHVSIMLLKFFQRFNASSTRVLSCKNKWSCFLYLKQKEFVRSKICSFVTYLLFYHGNYTFWFDKLAPCFK